MPCWPQMPVALPLDSTDGAEQLSKSAGKNDADLVTLTNKKFSQNIWFNLRDCGMDLESGLIMQKAAGVGTNPANLSLCAAKILRVSFLVNRKAFEVSDHKRPSNKFQCLNLNNLLTLQWEKSNAIKPKQT